MTSDPDQIRGQIAQTQQHLSADVNALSEKLSPPRIAQRQVRRTRAAMTNMKEKVMGSVPSGAVSARDTAGSRAAAGRDAVSSTASSARDGVSSAASSAADSVSSAAGSAGETVRAAPDMVRRQTEGNPLAAGLIAFGAGWLISSLLPATPAEQRVATRVKDGATEYGQPIAQQVTEAAQAAKDHLGESARDAAESVQETASGAVSAVRDEAQSATRDVSDRAGQAKDTIAEQREPSGP
jgi:gas vesicle protein